MADVTRRHFLRTAGIGAAAVTVMGATGTAIFDAANAGASTSATPVAGPAGVAASAVPSGKSGDIFAHVSDVKAGKITIFSGTSAYTITNPALAAALAAAAK